MKTKSSKLSEKANCVMPLNYSEFIFSVAQYANEAIKKNVLETKILLLVKVNIMIYSRFVDLTLHFFQRLDQISLQNYF